MRTDRSRFILGMRVDGSTYGETLDLLTRWARAGESRYVCVSTVHMVMESWDDPTFREAVNGADFVTSDGMPLVWSLRLLGVHGVSRVYGPYLTPLLCEAAASEGIPVGFYGGTAEVIEELTFALRRRYPALEIRYSYSPPFRPLSDLEEEQIAKEIRESGARILFVGLGCPKQERWMQRNRHRIPAVAVGVGAAFDFVAGRKPQAPPLMMKSGLEWLFRLLTEPRRLWKRYLYHNPRFLVLFGMQLLREGLGRSFPRPPARFAGGATHTLENLE